LREFDAQPEPEPEQPDFVAHEEGLLDVKDLVVMGKGGKPMTDSLKVAKVFGKAHKNVIQSIEKLIEKDVLKFQPISIADAYGRLQPAFEMDRDGFALLTFGFTGDKALKFKLDYIAAFNAMEEKLKAMIQPADEFEVLAGVANGLFPENDARMTYGSTVFRLQV